MYQSESKMIGDNKVDLLADCHSVLNRWTNHFCQLLNAYEGDDTRQTEIGT